MLDILHNLLWNNLSRLAYISTKLIMCYGISLPFFSYYQCNFLLITALKQYSELPLCLFNILEFCNGFLKLTFSFLSDLDIW